MQNVLNTLRVLDEVAERQPVGVGQLARVLAMPKSSVQRALKTLEAAGWIRPNGGELTRWVMTAKALRLSYRTTALSLRDAAMPVMEELRARTEETIHLMVPEGDQIVLIQRLETPKPVRIVLPLGIGLPLYASANGKAVLAHSGPEVIDAVVGRGLDTFTDTTITNPQALLAELEQIREQGYATNNGEWRSDIAAVASAVMDGRGQPLASIGVSTPARRMPAPLRKRYGAMTRDAATALSEIVASDTLAD